MESVCVLLLNSCTYRYMLHFHRNRKQISERGKELKDKQNSERKKYVIANGTENGIGNGIENMQTDKLENRIASRNLIKIASIVVFIYLM